MKCFGTVDEFICWNTSDLRIGRLVANHEFMKALLTYGTFDLYYFFVPDIEYLNTFEQGIRYLITDKKLRERVRVTVKAALKEVLLENSFIAFHQGDFTRYLPYIISFRNRYAKTPFVATGATHSLDPYFMPSRFLHLELAPMASYDAIICTSMAGQKVVQKGFQSLNDKLLSQAGIHLSWQGKFAHIPLGIEDSRFEIIPRNEARKKLGLQSDAIYMLCLGRLSLRTKMDFIPLIIHLANAWKKGDFPKLQLLLVGGSSPHDLAYIKKIIDELGVSKKVVIKTDISTSDKGFYYSASDFFISMSDNIQETFGLVVVEAMAAGLPAIVSDYDGYRELVIHEKTGYRIPTMWTDKFDLISDLDPLMGGSVSFYGGQVLGVDIPKTMQAIRTLYYHQDYRQTLGNNARQHAKQYRWQNIIEKYETIWLELHSEAIRQPWNRQYSPHIFDTNPFETFSHYPTKIIDRDQKFTLSDYGQNVQQTEIFPPIHPDFQVLFHKPLAISILEYAKIGFFSIKIADELLSHFEITEDVLAYHALWLYKYGIIMLVDDIVPKDII